MAATTAPAPLAFRVLGTTTDFTTCELCGRDELRGTLVLQPLDADGTADGDPVHYGSDCGARAAGTKAADLRKAATAADRATHAAARESRERAAAAASAAARALDGTADCHTAPSICRRMNRGCVAHG